MGGTKIRRGALDYQFLLITIILIAFGMIMLYSASSSRAYAAQDGDSLYFVKRQLAGFMVGIAAMVGCMAVDYHIIAKMSKIIYVGGVILLILVLVPGVGTTSNGATRWLFGFQPSELVKVAMVLSLSLIHILELFDRMASRGAEYVVMEVSSHALALDRVTACTFDVGAFTNITQDHLDFHKTMEEYLAAKSILFNICKNGVINKDDSRSGFLLENAKCDNIITYGIKSDCDLKACLLYTSRCV